MNGGHGYALATMGRAIAVRLPRSTLLGLALIAAGCSAHATPPKPRTLLERLAHAARIDGDDACRPTRGILVVERTKPSARPDYYPRFTAMARELARVQCEHAGPATFYTRFASHAQMQHALRLPKPQRPAQLCMYDHEVFDGDGLLPGQLRRWCAHLHGALRLYRTVPDPYS